MNTLLVFGILIVVGFVFGELANKLRLPRVTGYIIAGIFLNPEVSHLIPVEFVQSTSTVTNFALAIMTFEIGGTLALEPLRELGKGIAFMALGEAQLATLFVVIGTLVTLPFLIHIEGGSFISTYLPLALLLGALASPTDPSATLAVIHQYRAKGPVSFSIMGVAAVDDALGVINFSIAAALAAIFAGNAALRASAFIAPLIGIVGAIVLGVFCGMIYYATSRFLREESEGLSIVAVIAVLSSCYGVATLLGLDQLLATMTVGVTVVNLGRSRDRIFKATENYIEPLVFVLFFAISGMLLDFQMLFKFLPLVLLFILFRSLGKFTGAYAGATLARSPQKVRRYTCLGLIPQGGIVIGLALIARQIPGLASVSNILLSVIIGATVIHELIGPLTSRIALQKAGELPGEARKNRSSKKSDV